MATTLIFFAICLALFVVFNLPVLSWRRLKYKDQAVVITLNDPARKELIQKGVLFHVWWPFQRAYIYNTLPSIVDFPPARLPTGGAQPLEINVNGFHLVCQVVDAGKAFDAPKHNPVEALHKIAVDALTARTSQFDVTDLARGQLLVLKEQVKTLLNEKAAPWGVFIQEVILEDIDWPQAMLDASARVMVAQAEAQAQRLLSQTEVENYEREKKAQGADYRWRQSLDSFVAAVEKGLKFVGSDALLALLGLKDMEGGQK